MGKNYYIIPLFVPHEGCPHNCVFCNQSRITGESERVTRDIAIKTIDEYLETINSNNSTVEVSFFGGTFTAIREENQKELLEVAKHYKDKGLIDKIRLSTRPDYINEYILDYLKEYGVDIIELGVQSLIDDVLKLSGRGHSKEDVENASRLIKDYGFTLGHQLMIGLPGDTLDRDIQSVRDSIEMKPDIARIYPALVIKDTPMEIMYKRGTFIPYTLEEAVEASKIVFKEYKSNDVKVIRIGLQPTENITLGKDIIAGPFHPAFRELVEASILEENLLSIAKEHISSSSFDILINPKNLSKLYADKKKYFNDLNSKLKDININVVQDSAIDRESIIIKSGANEFKINL
ncbi:elongator complex protein 3 [Clostridium paridis]|uniref:Radical SAM protein n=1 Tax=Clostridium paridis TaxID=2803863 RepID=A0A937FDJ7_9CLOT|nr:radical SAM protein [Clostridium paridis]MBL4930850.1 radical SAM protein [Clostridium paridis]